jgi:hypothetical protein
VLAVDTNVLVYAAESLVSLEREMRGVARGEKRARKQGIAQQVIEIAFYFAPHLRSEGCESTQLPANFPATWE